MYRLLHGCAGNGHGIGIEDLIQLLDREEFFFQHQFPDGLAGLQSGLCNIGRVLVADVGAQTGDGADTVIQQILAAIHIGGDAEDNREKASQG